MKRDSPVPASLTVDPQRDLLSHRPRRHPHCRLFAEQLGDASLEPFRERTLTIKVDLVVRGGPLGETMQRRPRVTFRGRKCADDPLASSPDCSSIPLLWHESSLRRARVRARAMTPDLGNGLAAIVDYRTASH